MLEVVSFLLFVAVPAVLMGVLTVGVVLMGEYGWTRWRERRKAKDPGHQLFLLATEIEQCKCLIRSIKLGMTDEELSEYRETVQEELRVLASRVKLLDISPNPPKDTDGRREDSGRGWVRELQGRWEAGGRSSVAAQGP